MKFDADLRNLLTSSKVIQKNILLKNNLES